MTRPVHMYMYLKTALKQVVAWGKAKTVAYHSRLEGHVIVRVLDTPTVMKELPISGEVSDLPVRVILSGPFTSQEKVRAMQPAQLNYNAVNECLKFLVSFSSTFWKSLTGEKKTWQWRDWHELLTTKKVAFNDDKLVCDTMTGVPLPCLGREYEF